jgi:hypothetical protein
MLQPISASNKEPIWLITDTLVVGVGCMYGQGPVWKTIHPADFHLCKFAPAQMTYCTDKQEQLVTLEGLTKWEDKLLSWRFHILTDHNSLCWLKSQPDLLRQQVQWLEYLPRFNFNIEYIPGMLDTVADTLLYQYASDDASIDWRWDKIVNANLHLNPKGKDSLSQPFL